MHSIAIRKQKQSNDSNRIEINPRLCNVSFSCFDYFIKPRRPNAAIFSRPSRLDTTRQNYRALNDGRPQLHTPASATAARPLLGGCYCRRRYRCCCSPRSLPLHATTTAAPEGAGRLDEGHAEGAGEGLGHFHLYLRLHLRLGALCEGLGGRDYFVSRQQGFNSNQSHFGHGHPSQLHNPTTPKSHAPSVRPCTAHAPRTSGAAFMSLTASA